MKYTVDINGIEVQADYSEDSLNTIWKPLLARMTTLQRQLGRRILVMLAAPPGAGKSTICSFLEYLSKTSEEYVPVTAIGMDGFHRYQDDLLSHTTVRDGEEIPLVKIKGAPITFQLEGLKERVKRVAAGEVCGWPTYNRMTHNPLEDAITVQGDIILLEGNYLLLEEDGWKDLAQYADLTIGIHASEELLRTRLVDRKHKSGTPMEQAAAFVEYSDMVNVRTCLEHSARADVNLELGEDNQYYVI